MWIQYPSCLPYKRPLGLDSSAAYFVSKYTKVMYWSEYSRVGVVDSCVEFTCQEKCDSC